MNEDACSKATRGLRQNARATENFLALRFFGKGFWDKFDVLTLPRWDRLTWSLSLFISSI